jgi:hypothetical protein
LLRSRCRPATSRGQQIQPFGLGLEEVDDALFARSLGGGFQAGPGGVEIGHVRSF